YEGTQKREDPLRLKRASQIGTSLSPEHNLELINNSREKIRPRLQPANSMRFLRIQLHIELLAGIDQSIREDNCVLHMNVVVARAVNDQQPARQIRSRSDERTFVISRSILLRHPHVSLGICRVVEMPVAHRGNRHARFEARAVSQRIQRHAGSVTPSPES